MTRFYRVLLVLLLFTYALLLFWHSISPMNDFWVHSCFNFGSTTAEGSLQARTDYAACSGDIDNDQLFAGPPSESAGQNNYAWPDASGFDGVVYQRSLTRFADITNGLSNTYLIGEKYLDPDLYYNGQDGGDNENTYVGFDNDTTRTTAYTPMQDQSGYSDWLHFGSAHTSGTLMLGTG